ncbi:hypothetical protein [Candidatus Frankia alpina]|nr:hypothetical protein [Candidatus Frankia alpina]
MRRSMRARAAAVALSSMATIFVALGPAASSAWASDGGDTVKQAQNWGGDDWGKDKWDKDNWRKDDWGKDDWGKDDWRKDDKRKDDWFDDDWFGDKRKDRGKDNGWNW